MFDFNFGDGRLGDVEIKDGLTQDLNAYARVKSISGNVFEIENATESAFANFTAGETVLIHISATNGTDAEPLGKYELATIELVSENKLTLDKTFDADLNYFYVQLVTVPQFKNLSIKNATIAPPAFDVFKFIGGVIVFQVFDNFTMENSAIDLTAAGIPTQKKLTYRPLTLQEYEGETDGAKRAGEENNITAERLILNAGDGAAFIQAYNFTADTNSRIGNPKTHGRANCRGAADSPFKPSNITNIGGSTILIAAEKLKVDAVNFAKYRSADLAQGRGLCRCHIASNTLLPNDEKLYSFDILKDLSRVQKLGVQNFGKTQWEDDEDWEGVEENPTYQLNNFAQVTAAIGNKLFYTEKTFNGFTLFYKDAPAIIRNNDGEFIFTKFIDVQNDFVKVENCPPNPAQIISVPEFKTLTLDNYTCEKVLAVAVSDTLTINGEINILNPLKLNCGNSQSWNKFSGIFILAKKIIFGENARLHAGSMIITSEIEGFSDNIFTAAPNFVYQM